MIRPAIAQPLRICDTLEDNAARILQSDGSNRYSLGFFVLMMGVITPFT